jgi:maleate isomerase
MTSAPTQTLGVMTPHAAAGPEVEWPAMAGKQLVVRIARVPAPGGTLDAPGTPPACPAGLRAIATPAALNLVAATDALESVSAIGYASTTTGYVIGPDAERDLLEQVAHRCGVPVAGTAIATTTAFQAFDVDRVALLHPPWFDSEMTDLGAAYFRSQGFDVVASTSVDLNITPRRADPDEVASWISRHVPDTAQALFIGGNGFRVGSIIDRLEREVGRPVLTANQVLLWYLLRRLTTPAHLCGHGSLFAR